MPLKMRSILCCLLLAVALSKADRDSYSGYAVYRVTPSSDQDLAVLKDLQAHSKVDAWRESYQVGQVADLMVAPEDQDEIISVLNKNLLQWEVFSSDVEDLINQEEITAFQGARIVPSAKSLIKLSTYQSYDQINGYLDQLAKKYPNLCSVKSIATTSEGRQVKVIKIGTNKGKVKGIWIDGGIHAREWLAPATVLYFISQLVEKYKTDSVSKKLVDSINWWIVPLHNPDGYEYSRKRKRMWRKNRKPNPGSNCVGTDLNRNYAFHWMEAGASQNPCSDIYAGKKGFSELETKGLSDFVLSIKNKLNVFLTFHAYSQLWMTPWGYTSSVPSDFAELKKVAQAAVDALRKKHGTRYGKVTSSTLALYAAAGGSDDWAKGVAGIKYAYTIELRDKGRYGFIAPASEIIPSGEETWDGVKAVANYILAN